MAGAVLVAGGTGALGAGVLRELLDAGRRVTATWVEDHERERVERDFADAEGLSLVRADLMDPGAVGSVVDGVDDLRAVVNLVGGLARAAMPRLVEEGGGAYVGVSARAALRPFAGSAGYIAAKAAVLAFVQALDAEYRSRGVRCNVVLPSVIDTPANRREQPDADHSKWVPPAEIARVIRFLISDESAPVSGAAIPVYGRA